MIGVKGHGAFEEGHGSNLSFSTSVPRKAWGVAPIAFESPHEIEVSMRLDRRIIEPCAQLVDGGFACRWWMSATVNGMRRPIIVIENLRVSAKDPLYPVVYASRPEIDIRAAVRIKGCGPTSSELWTSVDKTAGVDEDGVRRYDSVPFNPPAGVHGG